MKKNKMIAALAVTAMVMCAVAPANVVYATEVNTQEAVETQGNENVKSAEDVKKSIPEQISIDISEKASIIYTTPDRAQHPGIKAITAELNTILDSTGYEVEWVDYVDQGMLYGYTNLILLSEVAYKIVSTEDATQVLEGTVNVNYANGILPVENLSIADALYNTAEEIIREDYFDGYEMNMEDYNTFVKNNENYLNKFEDRFLTTFKCVSDNVLHATESVEYEGVIYLRVYPFVGDYSYGSYEIPIFITSEADLENSMQTITDGITFVGGVGAKISAVVLEAKSEEYIMMTEAVQAMGYDEIFSAHEFTLEEGDISGGITIIFNVGEKNNGREAIVLHQLQNGEFEEFKSIVSGGVIVAEVTELSPFVVALGDELEGDIVDELDDEPQTGEGNFGFLFYTACLALGAVLLVKRKEA